MTNFRAPVDRADGSGGSISSHVSAVVAPPAPPAPLYDFLRDIDLLQYHDKLKNMLKLRHAGDLVFCEERDLMRVGMSRPEQKRLRFEFTRRFPTAPIVVPSTTTASSSNSSPSFVVKLRNKVFGGARDSTFAGDDDASTAPCTDATSDEGATSDTSRLSAYATDAQHVIRPESIRLCRVLGYGEFGCVYLAAWHYRTNSAAANDSNGDILQVAVKQIEPDGPLSNSAAFLQEAAIMTRMRHPNVVHLYGIVLDVKAVMLVSELAPCGSLLECLRCPVWREPFSVDTLCDFALQIANGMRYLASQRLVHRDLAARNVLVTSPTKIKISDFGLSRLLGVNEDHYLSSASKTGTARLPLAWCSPEAINHMQFNSASDVWAYGVTLWEMFTYGEVPWANMTGPEILTAVYIERRVLHWPKACPEEFYMLMRECWTIDVHKRPNFDAICIRLPEIMPQLLLSAVDSAHADDWSYLQHQRGDIIILLRKSSNSLDEYEKDNRINSRASSRFEHENLWLGALKRSGGLVGLFRPDETVAYLGDDYHNAAANSIMSKSILNSSKEIMSTNMTPSLCSVKSKINTVSTTFANSGGKKSKLIGKLIGGNISGNTNVDIETDKERRKLLISQPQGELRHTVHLGIDGQGFGLLNADKKELAKAIASASTVPFCSGTCQTTVTTSYSTTTTVSLNTTACIVNTMPADELATSVTMATISPISDCSPLSTDAIAPPRPPTAPPRRVKAPAESLETRAKQYIPISHSCVSDPTLTPPVLPPRINKGRTVPCTVVECSTSAANLDAHVSLLETEAEKLLADTKAATLPNHSFTRYNNNYTSLCEQSFNDAKDLNRRLNDLRRDITDFSLGTSIGDSDQQPLIGDDRQNHDIKASLQSKFIAFEASAKEKALTKALCIRRSPPTEKSIVRVMTSTECDRWREKVENEHKKVTRALENEFENSCRSENADRKTTNSINGLFCAGRGYNVSEEQSDEESQLTALRGPFTARFLSKDQNNEEGWSDEAQAAYKLLVQVGDKLRSTNMNCSLTCRDKNIKNIEESNSQKTIEYINPEITRSPRNSAILSNDESFHKTYKKNESSDNNRMSEPLEYYNRAAENAQRFIPRNGLDYANDKPSHVTNYNNTTSHDNNICGTSSVSAEFNSGPQFNDSNYKLSQQREKVSPCHTIHDGSISSATFAKIHTNSNVLSKPSVMPPIVPPKPKRRNLP